MENWKILEMKICLSKPKISILGDCAGHAKCFDVRPGQLKIFGMLVEYSKHPEKFQHLD